MMPVDSHISVQPLTELLKCRPVSHLVVYNLDQMVQLSTPNNNNKQAGSGPAS